MIFSRSETCLRVGSDLWFYANYLDRRLGELDGCSHATDHSSTPNRSQNHVNIRQIFKDFQPYRPLTGDDLLIIVGRNNHVSM